MPDLGEIPRHQIDIAEPPPNVGSRSGLRGACVGLLERGVNGGARRGRHERRVGVQADEEVGLVVVGHRRPFVERHVVVVLPRQQHADAEPAFDRRLEAAGNGEREIFFFRPAGPRPSSSPPCPGRSRPSEGLRADRAQVVPAMPAARTALSERRADSRFRPPRRARRLSVARCFQSPGSTRGTRRIAGPDRW